jgi:hypothetical protein
LTHCPTVQPIKIGEEVTTQEIDGANPLENCAYYAVAIPEGDFFFDAEFTLVNPKELPCIGAITSHTMQGELTSDIDLSVAENAPSSKNQLKLIVSEGLEVMLRVQPNGSKQKVKFKITPADEAR